MNEKEAAGQQTHKRTLVLCVDRDGDLETKAGIKTPVIGRSANIDAAVSLALRDPEEPDANAMFEAIRLIDRLQNEKNPEETLEVATISGSELGGVSADRKVVSELNAILDSFSASEVILVTDGYSDEAVLPLVQSRVPVSSVRRIVVKHSESIEETAAIFSKYARLLWDNPRYSRVALGLPGLLLFILGILAIYGFVNYYVIAIVLVVGGFLLLKGFGVDKAARDLYKWAQEYSPPPLPVQVSTYTAIAGILCAAISIYLGAANASAQIAPVPVNLPGWLNILPPLAGFFIKGVVDLMVVGIDIILCGRSIRLYFERDVRVLRNAALIVLVTWSRWIFDGTADILINPALGYENLVFAIIVGVLITIASVLAVYIIQTSAKDFFIRQKEKGEEFEEVESEIIGGSSK